MDDVAAVADTNALVFYVTRNSRLGARARRLLDAALQSQAIVYVPLGVVWEVAVGERSGRLRLRQTVPAFFEEVFSNPAFLPFDLTLDQIYAAATLGFHRDPFDGLIVAAAQSLDLPLLTSDTEIRESGVVQVIW